MYISRKRRLIKRLSSVTSVDTQQTATTISCASTESSKCNKSTPKRPPRRLTMGLIHDTINNIFLATVIPEFFIVLHLTDIIAFGTLKICLFLCLLVFVLMPLAFKCSVTIQRGILFLTFINNPKNVKFAEPEHAGLYASRNFYIYHNDPKTNENALDEAADETQIRLGLWHILPDYIARLSSDSLNVSESITNRLLEKPIPSHHLAAVKNFDLADFGTINSTNQAQFFERALQESSAEVILYLHGNSNSRFAYHRVELYQMLRALGYHVIAFDYRGFGDSAAVQPTEDGVVRDAIAVYKYVRSCTKNPIYLWGHSLGSGIATHMMAHLNRHNIPAPKAVVLESPFNNMDSEIRYHPMSRLFRNLPWFDYMISRPMYSNHLRFQSDQHIGEFREPVMILHAEDDLVIPFELGYRLYRSALDSRGKTWGPVEFHRFGSENGFGHKYICRSVELPHMIATFFDTYREQSY